MLDAVSRPELPALDTFENQSAHAAFKVCFRSKIKSICPYTEKADVSALRIEYIPGYKLIEVVSLENFIRAFEGISIFHETLLNIIYERFGEASHPRWLHVTIEAPMFSKMGGDPMTITLQRTSDD